MYKIRKIFFTSLVFFLIFSPQIKALSIEEFPSTITFGEFVLGGKTKFIYSLPIGKITIKDDRGTYEGYHLAVQSTLVQNSPTTPLFPPGSLYIDPPNAIQTLSGDASQAPTITLSSKAPIDNGSPITLVSASTGTGEGIYEIDFSFARLSLLIPSSILIPDSSSSITVYSTLTWHLISGLNP